MSQVTPIQTSFNGGELSPRMHGRIDQAIYGIGVKRMQGWLPTLQGPAEAAPGTIHVAGAATADFRLIPFGFTVTQHYVVEASDEALRFYTNEARIETSPGVPYEIVAPWTAAQLAELNWCQSGDVLYLYHPDVQTRKLSRTSATTFALEAVEFAGGPFDARNQDETLTLSASGVVGDVTVTASAALFAASDVGGLLRLEAADLGLIPAWEPGLAVTAGELRQSPSLGIVYQALTGGRTGTVEPTHPEGAEWDGAASGTDINSNAAGGIQWLYLHDRYGLLRITAYTSATEVDCEVVRRLPFTLSSAPAIVPGAGGSGGGYNPWEPTPYDPETYEYTPPGDATFTPGTWRWQFGSFSNRRGWPACGAIWNERHCLGKDNVVHGSVVGDFENLAPLNELGDISIDMAFQSILAMPDAVRWIVGDERLLVGTATAEYALGAASAANAPGPGNIAVASQSRQGAATGMPVALDGRVLFVQCARRRMVEYGYALERDRFDTPDLSRFAEHIGQPGFVHIAYAGEPGHLLWAVRDDGVLTAAIYEPREQALGWATRVLGGGMLATSVCAIRDSNGEFDQLWVGATTADGSEGHVLRMARVRIGGEEAVRQVMLDAAVIEEGDAIASVTAAHLAGRTVTALVDGVPYPGLVASGAGLVTLPVAGDEVIVGLPYPAVLTLLRPEAGGDNGPAKGKLAIIKRAAPHLHASRGLVLTAQGVSQSVDAIGGEVQYDTELQGYSGVAWMQTVGKFDRTAEISIERTLPYPATILCVTAEIDVAQHGGRG